MEYKDITDELNDPKERLKFYKELQQAMNKRTGLKLKIPRGIRKRLKKQIKKSKK